MAELAPISEQTSVRLDRTFSRVDQILAPDFRVAGLQREIGWLQARGLSTADRLDRNVLATRWSDQNSASRHRADTPIGRHVLSISLKSSPIKFRCAGKVAFDGVMNAGAVFVMGSARPVAVEAASPCDFVQFYVADTHLQRRLIQMGGLVHQNNCELNGRFVRDPVIELLTKSLLDENALSQRIYTEAIAEAVLARLVLLVVERPSSTGLPKWRLRRVEALIEENLSNPIGLADMAAAAGLSRMHFAAQFKAATGSSPHEYLTRRRVEVAKVLLEQTSTSLAQVALSVGFHAQAHFTTVFRRLTGETPGRWRRDRYANLCLFRSQP